MIPVFSFTAYSNTGKTTYIEKLISCLTEHGVRVAAVKHDGHALELDKPGKDSWRFARAGAKTVAVSSGECCAVMYYRPMTLDEILRGIDGADVILVEGWHGEGRNLIGIYRQSSRKGLKVPVENCVAVVSDTPLETGAVPLFPLDDPAPMVEFIMRSIEMTGAEV